MLFSLVLAVLAAAEPRAQDGWTLERMGAAAAAVGLAFDYQDQAYVLQQDSLARLGGAPVAQGGPWTGVAFRDGRFFLTGEGGVVVVSSGGAVRKLVDGFRAARAPAFGPDGWLYFAEGALTNAGVVSAPDDPRDAPCRTVTLTGRNFDGGGKRTGAYVPFGLQTPPGRQIDGAFPCSGSIVRAHPELGRAELVAWGFRSPGGLAFAADGRLYAAEEGYDESGPRPVWGGGDLLWAVQHGAWHGWPDWSGAEPLPLEPLIQDPPNKPPRPAAELGAGAGAAGLDISEDDGRAYVALSKAGRVAAVDPRTGFVEDVAWGFDRPAAARFDRSGASLWVADRDGVWKLTRKLRPAAARWTPESLRGRVVFYESCHRCHPNGRAGLGPAIFDSRLALPSVRRAHRKLPSWRDDKLDDRRLEDLTAYMKELKGKEEP